MADKTSKVAYAILADGHRAGPMQKLDALGIFNRFLVFATPAVRECSLVVGLTRMPPGTSPPHRVVLRDPEGQEHQVAEFAMQVHESTTSSSTATRLQFQLHHLGEYRLGVGPSGGTSRSLKWFDFRVDPLPWPELPTGEKLTDLLADPNSLKFISAKLSCGKCAKSFTFGLSLDPEAKLPKGVRPFPREGRFKCAKCGNVLPLKDIEGLSRAQLVNQASRGEK